MPVRRPSAARRLDARPAHPRLAPVRLVLVHALAITLAAATPGAASGQQDCKMLFCSPALTLSPSLAVTNVFDQPRVRRASNGTLHTLEPTTRFALLATLAIPMAVPRTSAVAQLVWAPSADGPADLAAGASAGAGDDADTKGNAPLVEFGLQLELLPARQTGGWLRVDAQLLDQFSPATRAGDGRAYTHKLNLELDAAVSPLRGLAPGNWFRNLELYATLDYLATGRPRVGDELPRGGLTYLDDASPWSLFAGVTIPVAPIAPPQ